MRRWRRSGCSCRSCSCRESCQCVRKGQCVCSLYQRECCRSCQSCGCGGNCGCNCGCGCSQNNSGNIQTVCYCSRYVDVPMSIYYGPGYTQLDCCMTQNGILQEISDTLSSCCRSNSCC